MHRVLYVIVVYLLKNNGVKNIYAVSVAGALMQYVVGLELDVLVLIVCIVWESNSYQFECNEVCFEMDNSYNEHD